MPKTRNSKRSAYSRRSLAMAGGGGPEYVMQMAGDGATQYKNVYENPAHTNSPTGGGMWLSNGSNVAFQGGNIPLMSGGGRGRRHPHRRTRRHNRSNRPRKSHRKSNKTNDSWFSKFF